MLRVLKAAIEMNTLTNVLDHKLLRAPAEDIGVQDSLTAAKYAQDYRICDNYNERRLQIDLVTAILEEAIIGAGFPMTGIPLRSDRITAYRASWSELFDFF